MNRDPRIATYFDIFCPQWQKTYHKSGLKKKPLSPWNPSHIFLYHVCCFMSWTHLTGTTTSGSLDHGLCLIRAERLHQKPGWDWRTSPWCQLVGAFVCPFVKIASNWHHHPQPTTYNQSWNLSSPKKNQGPYFKAIKSLGHFFSI